MIMRKKKIIITENQVKRLAKVLIKEIEKNDEKII